MDTDACNFHDWATDDDGSCVLAPTVDGVQYECQDGEKRYFDPCVRDLRRDEVCFKCKDDLDGDGVCAENEVVGCEDETACNFNPDATEASACLFDNDPFEGYTCVPMSGDSDLCAEVDVQDYWYEDPPSKTICFRCLADVDSDGVCDDDEISKCKVPTACNYETDQDPKWDLDNSLCVFPNESYLDCDGNCLSDVDGDELCDELEIPGCQDESACNYDSSATDPGTCDYSCTGCMDASACNYDDAATKDDASACVFKLSEKHECPTYSEDGTAHHACKIGFVADCRSDHTNCCSYDWLMDTVCDDGSIEVRGCDLTCIEGNREETPCKAMHGNSWTPPSGN